MSVGFYVGSIVAGICHTECAGASGAPLNGKGNFAPRKCVKDVYQGVFEVPVSPPMEYIGSTLYAS